MLTTLLTFWVRFVTWHNYYLADTAKSCISALCIRPYSFTNEQRMLLLYFSHKGTVLGSQYGPGTGLIWNQQMRCVGNEKSTSECVVETPEDPCRADFVVSISCGSSPVQYGSFVYIWSTENVEVENTKMKKKTIMKKAGLKISFFFQQDAKGCVTVLRYHEEITISNYS